jgi:ABC-2 type transport system ATP-binding protein
MSSKDREMVVELKDIKKVFKINNSRSIKSIFVNPLKKTNKPTQVVLKKISINVYKGEFLGIVGRNGSGKSTLLKIISNIYQPTTGTRLHKGNLVSFIELGVGFDGDLTGKENVYLSGALLGYDDKYITKKYKEIVEFSELSNHMNKKLKNYSSGMQVRLAFSVATILADADILVIDEVLAVGDADFQIKCFNYFKEIKELGKTVIFVSHDMDAVREFCTRAILIDKGEIVVEGNVNKVAESYTKLFADNKASSTYEDNTDSDQWGDGGVSYQKPTVKVTDENIVIKAHLTIDKDIKNLVLGFTIKDAAGNEVTGTNTRIKAKPLRVAAKGQKYIVEWRLPNILGDGFYNVSVTAHGSSGLPVYQWWNKSATFKIIHYEKAGYTLSPPIDVELSEVK